MTNTVKNTHFSQLFLESNDIRKEEKNRRSKHVFATCVLFPFVRNPTHHQLSAKESRKQPICFACDVAYDARQSPCFPVPKEKRKGSKVGLCARCSRLADDSRNRQEQSHECNSRCQQGDPAASRVAKPSPRQLLRTQLSFSISFFFLLPLAASDKTTDSPAQYFITKNTKKRKNIGREEESASRRQHPAIPSKRKQPKIQKEPAYTVATGPE